MEYDVIQPERIQPLNDLDIRNGKYVLYWMQQSQRAEENHALEYAIARANDLKQPVLVVFDLMDDYPDANLRHYTFMLEGLRETYHTLAARGIQLIIQYGYPVQVALAIGKKASLIVCDRGYLSHQKQWRWKLAEQANCRVIQVEGDVVVPVEVVSGKAEYAARTIRPKIHKRLESYLTGIPHLPVEFPSLDLTYPGVNLQDIETVLKELKIDRRIASVRQFFQGGTSHAKARFQTFLENCLGRYDQHSNQPQTDDISYMSPYLHFGQISPLYLALQILQAPSTMHRDRDAYLEQLIVRRELAMNFVEYTKCYDSYTCIPEWAKRTLDEHRDDERDHIYSLEQLEQANTHDPYWNAAMQEMQNTGFMHNYMRMYWGKKILEWSETPEQAFTATLYLNNRYFLDGRDPNSYAGVAWLYGVHDRAWSERPIFGKIRYMAASGLERKCDIHAYIQKVEHLSKQGANP